MKRTTLLVAMILLAAAATHAQETKPVPKGSVRVSIPGCARGYIFTVGARTTEEPGSVDVAEGMRLRLNGPKKMMKDIKAHEGSMIVITGLIKQGQYGPSGITVGGIRITPGVSPSGGRIGGSVPTPSLVIIDVEGWRQATGACSAR